MRGVAGLYALDLDKLLDMKRRADERQLRAGHGQGQRVATRWIWLLRGDCRQQNAAAFGTFLFALGIPPCRRIHRQTLADCLGQLDWVRRAPAALAALPDIGAVVATPSPAFLPSWAIRPEVDALLAAWRRSRRRIPRQSCMAC